MFKLHEIASLEGWGNSLLNNSKCQEKFWEVMEVTHLNFRQQHFQSGHVFRHDSILSRKEINKQTFWSANNVAWWLPYSSPHPVQQSKIRLSENRCHKLFPHPCCCLQDACSFHLPSSFQLVWLMNKNELWETQKDESWIAKQSMPSQHLRIIPQSHQGLTKGRK